MSEQGGTDSSPTSRTSTVSRSAPRTWTSAGSSDTSARTFKASQAFWQVDDADKEIAELTARGVAIENYDMPGDKSPSGAISAGGAKAAWFKDTEGSMLAMV